jgi:uncharacterized membrane protein
MQYAPLASMLFQDVIQLVSTGFEAAGVGALLIGSLIALLAFARALLRARREPGLRLRPAYRDLRRGLARAILLGLELLLAADVIRSVALDPTVQTVIVLGLIVLIRTFLSWTLDVEITGRWPWQEARPARLSADSDDGDA